MERDIKLVVIADPNNEESRQVLSELTASSVRPVLLTPMAIRDIIPIRATPAVGVLLWATDLQGLATDVESFAQYIKDETANKAAIAEGLEAMQAYTDLLAENIESGGNE